MPASQTRFSRALTLLRKEKNISQRIAAEGLNISQALLSHYETGAREPGLKFVARACDFYNVSADFLLGRTMIRDGGFLDAENIYDAETDNQNRLGRASASAIFGRKVVISAISILFDIAGRAGDAKLISELTNYFGSSIYKIFRHFYILSGENEGAFFSASQGTYKAAADSDISRAEGKILSILNRKKNPPDFPKISNEILAQEYPQTVRALLTLTHQSGERISKLLDL